jgi:hypothetical protein
MSDWREAEDDVWPVRFPADTAPRQVSRQPWERERSRWTGSGSVDSSQVRKRLVWLLLAAEIGMAVVAACLLPLVFVRLPVQEEGVIGAVVSKVGEWLGLSSQVACLVLVLPIPILLVTLGANWWWYRRIRRRAKETDE